MHDLLARFLPTAETDAPDDIAGHVLEAARAEGVTGWTSEALFSMFTEPIGITEPNDTNDPGSFVAGQHRVKAMRDAGLTHTYVIEYDHNEDPTNF